MPSDPVELTKQIKAASDIVAVVSSYLAVKPAGAIFKALCPFHNDSRPSLDIDPKRQRYKCWSCGAHGDSFAFVQHMEKVGFTEAQAYSRRAGIKLDERRTPKTTTARACSKYALGAEQIPELSTEDAMGEAARKYLGSRKLSGKTVREFGLGFASLDGDWLVKVAFEGGSRMILVEMGLTAARWRSRVLRPVPRSGDVPDPRRPRAAARVRRPDHAGIALCRAGPEILHLR